MTTGEQPAIAPVLRESLSKVPAVTALFWVTKVLTTGMGETASDFLVRRINPFVAVSLGALAFAAAMALQLRARRYRPWTYWLAVSMVSVFGTMAADVVHIGLGVPYAVSTVFFVVVLAAIFTAWYVVERTLSIHSIRTPRREAFYWATVLSTFALGTAAGDMTATTMRLGYFASGVLFAVVIAVPALAHRYIGLNAVVAFWFAYIVTRPLGASFADWLGVPASRRGLDLGTGPVTVVLAAVIAGLVLYLSVTGADTSAEETEEASAARR
ncbi:MAG: COG4705 family protein [Oryzihumus sp.]